MIDLRIIPLLTIVGLITFPSCGMAQEPKQTALEQDSQKTQQSTESHSQSNTQKISPDSIGLLLDSIAWNETTHKFEGGVPSGPPATFRFEFTNYSDRSITVKSVDAACSCTATNFSRNEIKPGESGWIEAAYKTANTFGFFKKYVDVSFSGSSNKHRLYLTGSVDPYKK